MDLPITHHPSPASAALEAPFQTCSAGRCGTPPRSSCPGGETPIETTKGEVEHQTMGKPMAFSWDFPRKMNIYIYESKVNNAGFALAMIVYWRVEHVNT